MADLTPPENSNFRFILIDVSSESSGRPGGRSSARSTPLENSNFRFILIDAYSEISGRPGGRDEVADLCPGKEQFQIHTDRCVLQELRQKSTGRSTPPENSNFRFILIDAYS